MGGYEEFFKENVSGLAVHQSGQGYGVCPLHEDGVKSFSVNIITSQWFCHAGCGSGNAITLARRLGVTPPSSENHIADNLEKTPLPYKRPVRPPVAEGTSRADSATTISKQAAVYEYQYEDGSPAHRTLRYEPKGFRQQGWKDGAWTWSMEGVRRVPYNLPKVLSASSIIFFVEGEKDADRLIRLGLVATTTPMGANSWKEDYAVFFKGKKVVILPDNDEPGHQFALQVARSITQGNGSVKILRLPGLPEKGDVSDFMDDNGDGTEQLLSLVRAAPIFGVVRHSSEHPLEYFKRVGLETHDGGCSLPHEFKALCRETYGQFVQIAGRCDDAVLVALEKAEAAWKTCRTKGQYLQFLRFLKEAHELSVLEKP